MKPRLPARLTSMHQETLINEFLGHYAADSKFISELKKLVSKHQPTLDQLTGDAPVWLQVNDAVEYPLETIWMIDSNGTYVVDDEATRKANEPIRTFRDDLQVLVHEWSLDRLPCHVGYDAVLSACLSLAANPDEPIVLKYYGVHDVPHVAGDVRSVTGRTFTITATGQWNPRTETPGQARTRLLNEFKEQLDSEIKSVTKRITDAGYTYPGDSEEQAKYMRWLYRRVALREPVDLIAHHPLMPQEPLATPDYVKKLTVELAKAIGIGRIPTTLRIK